MPCKLSNENAPEAVLADENDQKDGSDTRPGFWQVVLSILAAAIGVNSRRNQERDFQSSTPLPFIVGGVLFGVIFVLAIAFVVMLVLENAGAS